MVEIKHRYSDKVLCAGETAADAVTRAVRDKVDLGGADLRGADLRGADLYGANLRGADLRGANLIPSVLLASGNWGEVSDQLCADLMLWDASNHPDPSTFDRWAAGDQCPYQGLNVKDGYTWQRACNFQEKRALWGRGVPCRPYDLVVRLLAEKCPPWTEQQVEDFQARFNK
jgi:hypothetical protein